MHDRRIVSAFRKASASAGGTQDCVEVAGTADGGRAVRDSKNPAAGVQYFPAAGWSAFLAVVKAGEFDCA